MMTALESTVANIRPVYDTQRVLILEVAVDEGHPHLYRLHNRRARQTNRSALAIEPHVPDAVRSVDLQMEDDLVTAQRVRVPGVLRRPGQGAFVAGMLVMVQDLLLVHLVGDGH